MTDPRYVLQDQTIQNLISDHEITKETGIYLESDSNVSLSPADTMFSPFINMEFSKNDRLAMIYDNQPGHAWFNTGALRALQSHVDQTGVRIKTCGDFVKTFESLGYEIKQFGNTSSGKNTNPPNKSMLNKLTFSTMVPLMIGMALGWLLGKTVLALVIGGIAGLVLGVIISYRVINK